MKYEGWGGDNPCMPVRTSGVFQDLLSHNSNPVASDGNRIGINLKPLSAIVMKRTGK
jgi:hypothetical protein